MALCRRVGGKGDGSMLHYRRAEGKIVKCGALVKREVTVVCQVTKMAITGVTSRDSRNFRVSMGGSVTKKEGLGVSIRYSDCSAYGLVHAV